VGSSELGPIYRSTGQPSSCRSRHTNRVVRRRSAEPPLTARIRRRHTTAALSAVQAHRGTDGSNPFPSSRESANFQFLARCDCDGETRFIALAYGKFESSSLQRRVR